MTGRKKFNAIISIFLVLLLIFIWGNSCLSVERSAALSRWVMARILNGNESQSGFEQAHHLLRKAAHMCEFMLLALLLCLRFRAQRRPWLFGCLAAPAAALDETIQIFSKRGSSVTDVLIDCFGAAVGILLISLIFLISAKKTQKRRAAK